MITALLLDRLCVQINRQLTADRLKHGQKHRKENGTRHPEGPEKHDAGGLRSSAAVRVATMHLIRD